MHSRESQEEGREEREVRDIGAAVFLFLFLLLEKEFPFDFKSGCGGLQCSTSPNELTARRWLQMRHCRPMTMINNYCSFSTQENAAEYAWQRDDIFGRIATLYDRLCDVFSFGIHRLWKRRVAQHIASEDWKTLLDGATGTGDIILRVMSRGSVQGRTIVASDVSPKMLAIAEQRLRKYSGAVSLKQLDTENMPSVPTQSVDAYSISLGLKICNRHLALKEALRVLKPGGRLIVLEASNIPLSFLHRLYLRYMAVCMPILGWLATGGDASAYKYLLQGIRNFPSAEGLAQELRSFGFRDVSFERLSLGIVAIHTARAPPATHVVN